MWRSKQVSVIDRHTSADKGRTVLAKSYLLFTADDGGLVSGFAFDALLCWLPVFSYKAFVTVRVASPLKLDSGVTALLATFGWLFACPIPAFFIG